MVGVLFWVVVLLTLYTHVGYLGAIAILAHLRPLSVRRKPIRPDVSLLIVAHNEAKVIRQKLDNCLALDYPQEKLHIVIASDGSTDVTAEIAREYEPLGVAVIEFEMRRGKPSVLNDVVPKCSGEIVVLSDARQMYEQSALLALAENFADSSVGAVSGELHLMNVDRGTAGEGVGFYWRYEKFIRRHESRLDSTVGATGAIYAIRRDLFEPIAADTLLDDVLIPMRIVQRGYRVVFEPEARAFDWAAATSKEEFTRKVRTIGGNFQLFSREIWLLNPLRNRLWLQTVSHKGLRLLNPVSFAVALMANIFLLDQPLYHWTLALQILFYTAAAGGYIFRNTRMKIPLLSIPYVFCLLNWVTVVAFIGFITGGNRVTWEKASP